AKRLELASTLLSGTHRLQGPDGVYQPVTGVVTEALGAGHRGIAKCRHLDRLGPDTSPFVAQPNIHCRLPQHRVDTFRGQHSRRGRASVRDDVARSLVYE